jgi:putative membrane protein
MRSLKRLLVVCLLALVLVFGVLFSIQNTDKAALDLLVIQLPEQRVSLWVLLAFATGGIVGMLISSAALIRLKSQNLLLLRKLDKSDKELAALRTSDFGSSVAVSKEKGKKS